MVYVHGPPGMLTHFFMPLTPCISLAQCQVPSTVLVCSRNPQQQEFPKLLNFFFYNGMKIKHFRHLYFGKLSCLKALLFLIKNVTLFGYFVVVVRLNFPLSVSLMRSDHSSVLWTSSYKQNAQTLEYFSSHCSAKIHIAESMFRILS